MRKDNFVMEKTEIKAVLLDVDNTLLDFDESSRVSMYAAAEQLGIALPEGFIKFLNASMTVFGKGWRTASWSGRSFTKSAGI